MEKLKTIQKRDKLNQIHGLYGKSNGGAYHQYVIEDNDNQDISLGVIDFQEGARHIENKKNGIIDTDLLEIVRHRLQCFQEGDYKTRENAVALTHIEEALMWLNRRVEERAERSVLGTMNK